MHIPYIVDGLTVEVYLPEDYTNGVNLQKISGMSIGSISGGKFEKKIITDKYGNKKLHLKFYNVKNEIFIDYGFLFSSRVSPRQNKFTSAYPLNLKILRKYSRYLLFTPKVQRGHKGIIGLVSSLKSKYNSMYKITLEILKWARKHVIHDPNVTYNDGLTTYLNRKGNENGLINLVLMLLRTAKIPCRVVKGISIDKKYVYRTDSGNIEIRYPRGYYKWIEVFFPTRAWVPFDIFASYFYHPDNIIRLGIGNDTDEIKDLQRLSNGILIESDDNFFIESMKFNKYLDSEYSFENIFQTIVLPPGKDFSFTNKIWKNENKIALFTGKYLHHQDINSYPIYLFTTAPKNRRDYSTLIQFKVTKDNSYAQMIDLKKALFLDHIALPIYFSGIYPAKVRVEIFKDNNGKPGELYARSYYKILRESPEKLSVHKFYFQRHKWPYLKKARYWIILRSMKKGQVYWYGIFGNPLGTTQDTRKNDGANWDTICNVDLMFEIWGNYKSRPGK